LPFLLIFVFYIAYTEKKHLLGQLFTPVKEYQKNLLLALVVTSAVTITLFITPFLPFQLIILSLILIYILTMVISRIPNRIKAIVVSIITVYALYQNLQVTLIGIVVVFISINIHWPLNFSFYWRSGLYICENNWDVNLIHYKLFSFITRLIKGL